MKRHCILFFIISCIIITASSLSYGKSVELKDPKLNFDARFGFGLSSIYGNNLQPYSPSGNLKVGIIPKYDINSKHHLNPD